MTKSRDDDTLNKVGERVKTLRELFDLSQKQLAYEANTTEVQIRRIEKGKTNVCICIIKNIAGVFNLELKDFFDYKYLPKKS